MKIELNLEFFKGFYNSYYTDEIDAAINDDLDELGLNYDDVDISYDFKPIAEDIVMFYAEFYEEFPFISNVEFSELVSPKYYNYSNDKIYFNCNFDKDLFIDWIIKIDFDFDELKELIYQEHSNRSGFISFHSNNINDWIKDLINFDPNNAEHLYKLGFILSSLIEIEDEDLDLDCLDYIRGNVCLYNAFNSKEINNAFDKLNK